MRTAFSKAALATIRANTREAMYVNIARMRNGQWVPCWTPKYFGASTLQDAQRLRALWLAELRGEHPRTGKPLRSFWNKATVRTIRIA